MQPPLGRPSPALHFPIVLSTSSTAYGKREAGSFESVFPFGSGFVEDRNSSLLPPQIMGSGSEILEGKGMVLKAD